MNKPLIFFIGILIGASLGYGVHWGMTDYKPEPAAYPLRPSSQCLWFGRFCESQEDGGLCFDCKVI
jgi:hypothetical protein